MIDREYLINIMDEWDTLNSHHRTITNTLYVIEDLDLSSDGTYLFDSWQQVKDIEKYTGLDIDTVLDEWVFNDEYTTCATCGALISLHPQYEGDTTSYWMHEFEGPICSECTHDTPEEYIEGLVNNYEDCNTILNLEDCGFKPCHCQNDVCEFWAGLRNRKQDEPKAILEHAILDNPDFDYVFEMSYSGMFDTIFTLYHRIKNYDMYDL